MQKVAFVFKIESSLIKRIKEFFLSYGIKQGFFVEKALQGQLEKKELTEDMLDLERLRYQEESAISFEDYLKRGLSL